MKKWIAGSVLVLSAAVLGACGSGEEASTKEAESLVSDGVLTVGVTGGPHEELVGKVAELAEEQGLDFTIETKVFSDYVMPNVALAEEEIDLNSFQTEPFFEEMKKSRDLDLVRVGDTVTFPMGIYSLDYKDVSELPEGAKIGLPSDPTNSGRALALFEKAGLLKVKEGVGLQATVMDIAENKNNYEFIELDSAQIPRQLNELDAAAINTNFALEAGFVPAEDSIFIEPSDSPFVNLVASRTENKDDEAIKQFLELYHSDEVKQFIEKDFSGSLIPSW
ncbi:MetQ/NlpA family ABC transporter substrate-binding protein [Planococcus shenhongbingii]|uniref:Lipoprotein n=1 Tax=Planococcus shenhongbingii TaxID=3058398 RepID=A0ABT8NEK1_9BACL|nr:MULTISPECIES: MetQ/NlpA family ABC transporter substrate-binding protein [unclassified Planococcus (in: firmicutes)]MDN7246315.1 MetQ/NlpA family ABC transporter substrate-binding protein [Planococcus sp. N017]WKA59321.1 MetQ/NlpA family ABC transporter substrate-binding protein [Planococcus sp. N016]